MFPDVAYNTPQEVPLPALRVRILGGDEAYSNADGEFVLITDGDGAVTVRADLMGPWVEVHTVQGGDHWVEQSVVPPGPAELLFNPSPWEMTTAQVNGYVHVNLAHDFYKQRQPGYSGLDFPIACNVNFRQTCNASFSSEYLCIHFRNAGDGCANSAFSSIITHEYGHFILHTLGVPQGAFGEGFADSLAILLYDDPVIGRDFRGPGNHVRNTETANVRYPCSGPIHACGQLLAGVWWDIKRAMQKSLGSAKGLETTRQLFTDWSQITIGGIGSNSAHPLTAVEIFTVDDDDGNLANGTPHYDELCDAFSAHTIGCPQPPPIVFGYPDGRPELVHPYEQTEILVSFEAGTTYPMPATAFLHYRVGEGSFTALRMDLAGSTESIATLPALPCLETVEYYFSVLDVDVRRFFDPPSAPHRVFTAVASTYVDYLVISGFETPGCWTVGDGDDDAVTGIWERVEPVGTAAQPETDHTQAPGSLCWVTGQGVVGAHPSVDDVDDGKTTLQSPIIDLSEGDAVIAYWRWYSNNIGPASAEDVLLVDISNDGGQTWTNVETVGPSGLGTTGDWFFHEFAVSEFVQPTWQVVVRFVASDEGDPSIVEAAIDDFSVYRYECAPAADCNGNGRPDWEDLGSGASRDCNGNDIPDECENATDSQADSSGIGIPAVCVCDASLCVDGDPCTADTCKPDTGECVHVWGAFPFGDLNNDGLIDLDDLLCTLAGFADMADCPSADLFPCGGNHVIDTDDVLAVLDAFAGVPICPSPCLCP